MSDTPQDRREFVRLAVDLPTHPKLAEVDDPAAVGWLYVAGLCYAGQHLTDGELPRAAVVRFAGSDRATAVTLIDLGLWHENGHTCDRCPQPSSDGRVVVHDYLDHQRSKSNAEAKREAARKAAETRWSKHRQTKQDTPANAEAMRPASEPQCDPHTDDNGSSNAKPPFRNAEEETEGDDAPNGASTRARPRTRGTATLAELSSSAVTPTARHVVDQWRQSRPDITGYRPQTLRELAKAADGILRDGGDPDLVRAALDEFDRRTDVHSPRVLPHLYDDAVKARRATTAPPQPQQSASQTGRSKRDEKALGWFALADRLAAENDDTVTPLFADLPALEGHTA